ncbi:MAG: hypothetical protein KCCBMMGE_01934 [Candidatus Methanoperedenaceae archaeon GB37]|nr:MAG: hypothetical protein KCCBMMGE_01934 [Candidatus Methanoperedenaceae archaeon GB37]
MLSAPVCRQAGWLNAECKLKNAKSPSVKLERLARLHVRTLTRWNWELETGKWEFLFSIFLFLFPSLCTLTRSHIHTFTR